MSQPTFMFRVLLAPLCFFVLFLGGAVHADVVDEQLAHLKNSTNYKFRVSAALTLTKLADERAVRPFVSALKDPDKTVRGVCAVGLGKMVGVHTDTKLRRTTLARLKGLAEKDASAFVHKQARKAHYRIKNQVTGETQ